MDTVSVVIPNYNNGHIIGSCLESVLASSHRALEIIVVDDGSTDNSKEIIKQYPCTLIQLEQQGGAAHARNQGAARAQGDLLFFTDSDCILQPDCLKNGLLAFSRQSMVVGGTYTPVAYDKDNFYSMFQAGFVHFFELKNAQNPDYIATHALLISTDTFKKTGGFQEDFLPILEDVEFSHRLLEQGNALTTCENVLVAHNFGYDFSQSLKNGLTKTRYWVEYSIGNKDLLRDSGTASHELKINVASFCLFWGLMGLALARPSLLLFSLGIFLLGCNMLIQRKLFVIFSQAGGMLFASKAIGYYLFIYPLPILAGTILGTYQFFKKKNDPAQSS